MPGITVRAIVTDLRRDAAAVARELTGHAPNSGWPTDSGWPGIELMRSSFRSTGFGQALNVILGFLKVDLTPQRGGSTNHHFHTVACQSSCPNHHAP